MGATGEGKKRGRVSVATIGMKITVALMNV
jgi:hypothetical protein